MSFYSAVWNWLLFVLLLADCKPINRCANSLPPPPPLSIFASDEWQWIFRYENVMAYSTYESHVVQGQRYDFLIEHKQNNLSMIITLNLIMLALNFTKSYQFISFSFPFNLIESILIISIGYFNRYLIFSIIIIVCFVLFNTMCFVHGKIRRRYLHLSR